VCVCSSLYNNVYVWVSRRLRGVPQVAGGLANQLGALLHGAQLPAASLAPLVPAHLPVLHTVDRLLLLPHGLDGRTHTQSLTSP